MHCTLDSLYELDDDHQSAAEPTPAAAADDDDDSSDADDTMGEMWPEPGSVTITGDRLAAAIRDHRALLRPVRVSIHSLSSPPGDVFAGDDDGPLELTSGQPYSHSNASRLRMRRLVCLYAPALLLALLHAALQLLAWRSAEAAAVVGGKRSAWGRAFDGGMFAGSVVFTGLLYTLLLVELGSALLSYNQRLHRIKRFTRLTERNAEKELGLPRLKLDCAGNIKLWARLRQYLQQHEMVKKVYFEIVLAFLMLSVGLLNLVMLLNNVVLLASSLSTAVVVHTAFHTVAFGAYVLLAVVYAAEMDRILKSHVKLLHRCQWKLEKNSTEDVRPLAESPFSRSVALQSVASPGPASAGRASIGINSSSMALFDARSPTAAGPGSAVSLLSRLVRVLEDEPAVKILGMKIDWSFVFKIGSYISLGVVSSIRKMLAEHS
eukprot:TRINITY_DN2053_c0_g1_i2.p1 TRINITY_DN2053_c0_g1~~TRINITY_DN2053_c0_g1_i2.p1  ORF type:complete len:434 (+),score=160.53 TRINITY_DN2053_c0_g1_i2:798-2099(+)